MSRDNHHLHGVLASRRVPISYRSGVFTRTAMASVDGLLALTDQWFVIGAGLRMATSTSTRCYTCLRHTSLPARQEAGSTGRDFDLLLPVQGNTTTFRLRHRSNRKHEETIPTSTSATSPVRKGQYPHPPKGKVPHRHQYTTASECTLLCLATCGSTSRASAPRVWL